MSASMIEALFQHWNHIRVKDRRIQDTTFTSSYYDRLNLIRYLLTPPRITSSSPKAFACFIMCTFSKMIKQI